MAGSFLRGPTIPVAPSRRASERAQTGGRGSAERRRDLVGPGADRVPVPEVTVRRLHRLHDHPFAEPELLLVERTEEDAVVPGVQRLAEPRELPGLIMPSSISSPSGPLLNSQIGNVDSPSACRWTRSIASFIHEPA